MTVLRKGWPEGTSTEDVALDILKAHDKTLDTLFRPIGPPLRAGLAFKSILTTKTHYVAWVGLDGEGREVAWVVTEDSDYGWVGSSHSLIWRWITVVSEKETRRRIKCQTIKKNDDGSEETIAGWEKGKEALKKFQASGGTYTMDDEGFIWKIYPTGVSRILGKNDAGVITGERITFRQDDQYTIEAVFCGGALLRHRRTGQILAEENSSLKKFYRDGWKS